MIHIYWSAASIDEARKVARLLVEERLVACASLIPWVESIYLWKGTMETSQEVKVIFKTLEIHFEKVEAIIRAHASYEVPEIVTLRISDSSKKYEEWVLQTVNLTEVEASL